MEGRKSSKVLKEDEQLVLAIMVEVEEYVTGPADRTFHDRARAIIGMVRAWDKAASEHKPHSSGG